MPCLLSVSLNIHGQESAFEKDRQTDRQTDNIIDLFLNFENIFSAKML